MAIVDLGAGGPPFSNGERRNNAGKGKGGNKAGFPFLFRLIAIGSVFSQVVFVFLVSLGRAKLELSMNGTGYSLGAKQSLSSFVRDSGGESSDEEDIWNGDKVWPKPYGWENYHYNLIRKHFACKEYAHDQDKPLNTLEDWRVFQSTYKETVDPNAVFNDPVPPTMGKTHGDGGPPPYHAAHTTDGRGRGLFASRDIKEGELVEDCCSDGDVVFPDAASFRRFLFNLPRNRACDQIDWSWTQKLEDGKYHILTSMHIAILFNSGKGSEINMAPRSNTERKLYATRDIKKGDQLLYDYRIYKTRWSEVGMGDVVREASASDVPRLGFDAAEKSGHRREPVWPKPRNWESYDIKEIGIHFHCEMYARDNAKPLPALEDWRLLRRRYAELVDGSRPFDDPVPPTEGYTLGDGGPPPFYAKASPDARGRGLFAARDITKGELTHDGARANVAFPDGAAWRRFVFSLPRNRACDVLDWTWTQRVEEGGRPWILAGMDVSALHNGGRGDDANVNPRSPASLQFYATRDIKKDEELLTDYFIYDTEWGKVGLG